MGEILIFIKSLNLYQLSVISILVFAVCFIFYAMWNLLNIDLNDSEDDE
jgi:hypothetical protein